jgi:hypothetical protein
MDTLLLAQSEAPEPLSWGETIAVIMILLGVAAAGFFIVRAAGRGLRSVIRKRSVDTAARSDAQQRRRLGALVVVTSILLGTFLSSQVFVAPSSPSEQIIAALIAIFATSTLVGPIVLLPSSAFRLALFMSIVRTADRLRIPWRTWTRMQWLIALPVNLTVIGLFAWPMVATTVMIHYLRGDFDEGVDTRIPWNFDGSTPRHDRQPPPPTGPRRDPQAAATGRPRTAAQPAPERRGTSTSPLPAEPERGPRRRWWQSSDEGTRRETPKEPKFKTRSGGDGQTQLTARRASRENDAGQKVDLIEIAVDASFRVPRAGSPVVTVLELLDVTDGAGRMTPVHRWGTDTLNTGGPYRFEDQSTVPHASARLRKVYPLQPRSFHAPHRGDRTIRARFSMHRPRTPHDTLTEAWVEFPYREEIIGYVEAPRLRLQTETGIATAGFAAVVADGEVDTAEMKVLEQFLALRHRRVSDDGELAGAAWAAITSARMRFQGGTSARELLQQAGQDLAGTDEGPRASAYELAVRIMASDRRITEDELDRLNELAEVLRLDAETTATIRNRYTDISMFEGEDVDPLGVPAGAPAEQRTFLREELRKWRSVLTNPDPQRQQQAQQMIDRITERISEIDDAAAPA